MDFSRTLRKAVYPGSFDPITLGHVDIITRISKLYDEVIVLFASSTEKTPLFSLEERMSLAKESLKTLSNVRIDSTLGLTVNYVRSVNAQVIVRGLRAVVDFEYELGIGNINRKLAPEIETILVFASPEYYFISSRAVKELVLSGGSPEGLVPEPVGQILLKRSQEKSRSL